MPFSASLSFKGSVVTVGSIADCSRIRHAPVVVRKICTAHADYLGDMLVTDLNKGKCRNSCELEITLARFTLTLVTSSCNATQVVGP